MKQKRHLYVVPDYGRDELPRLSLAQITAMIVDEPAPRPVARCDPPRRPARPGARKAPPPPPPRRISPPRWRD